MANALIYTTTGSNLARAERIGSALAGSILIGRAFARPTLGRIMLAVGGAALLQYGLTGRGALWQRLDADMGRADIDRIDDVCDPVDCTSDDSFPASDPPSWTPVGGPARR